MTSVGLIYDFFDMTPKVQATKAKINKYPTSNLEKKQTINLLYSKGSNNMQKQSVGWEEILVNHVSDKGLISKIY